MRCKYIWRFKKQFIWHYNPFTDTWFCRNLHTDHVFQSKIAWEIVAYMFCEYTGIVSSLKYYDRKRKIEKLTKFKNSEKQSKDA